MPIPGSVQPFIRFTSLPPPYLPPKTHNYAATAPPIRSAFVRSGRRVLRCPLPPPAFLVPLLGFLLYTCSIQNCAALTLARLPSLLRRQSGA